MSYYRSFSPPAWGALPAEQYLLVLVLYSRHFHAHNLAGNHKLTHDLQHNWNQESAEAPDTQRQRLIRTFIRELDEIPKEWDVLRVSEHKDAKPLVKTPTEEDIQTILAP